MNYDRVDPDALNTELSQRLQHCVLVCELDLDEEFHTRLIDGVSLLHSRGITTSRDRLRRYAALVGTYLVAEGIFNFAAGAFFPNLSVKGLDRKILTDVFEYALRQFNLEKFSLLIESGAQRYLTPILAHGGIPKYSLGDFFRLVRDTENRVAADAAEMLVYWREHPSAFVNIDKPVERFLLYGGDISHDFLDRCLDLFRAQPTSEDDRVADHFALPRYVCSTFLELEPDERRWRQEVRGNSDPAFPRPYVIIDPWDGAGPILVLPEVGAKYLDGSWDVVAQEIAVRHRASRMERIVPLAPDRRWSVEFHSDQNVRSRTFTFAGLSRGGVLLFDEKDQRLITDFGRLRDSRVWILHPSGEKGALFRQSGEKIEPVEIAPLLGGNWDGYTLEAFDLINSEPINVGRDSLGQSNGNKFWVRTRGDRISMDMTPIPGVRTKNGLPVYPTVPSLVLPGFDTRSLDGENQNLAAWSVRLQVNGTDYEFDATALAQGAHNIVRSVTATDSFSEIRITARGPLGMDMRAEFCVVPNLVITRPSAIMLPAKQPEAVLGQVSASCLDGETVVAQIHPGDDEVELRFKDPRTELIVSFPCLKWAIVTNAGSRAELGQQRPTVTSTELMSNDTRLTIRLRKAGVALNLMLREGSSTLQTIHGQTAGDDGRWAFDLRTFADSVRSSSTARLELFLGIGAYEVSIGFVQAELEVDRLSVKQRLGNGDSTIVLSWEQGRNLNDRVARLWSLSMPWRPPVSETVLNDNVCEVSISRLDSELPPGFYLAEIGIADGWVAPQRPNPNARSTRQFRLGTDENLSDWLDALLIDDSEAALTMAAGSGVVVRTLTDDEGEKIVPLALEALDVSSSWPDRIINEDAVADLIAANPRALHPGLRTAALTWTNNHSGSFLGSVLPLISAIWRLRTTWQDDNESSLWEICAPIAALHDLMNIHLAGAQFSFESGSGASATSAASIPVIPEMRGRVPELQRLIGRSANILEAMRRESFLLPKLILDLETQASVQYEWLIADQRGLFSAEQWAKAHRVFGNKASGLDPKIFSEFVRVCAPSQLASGLPSICFPETVYIAALHVVCSTSLRRRAAIALHELVDVCPGIVSRSLILAAVHAYSATQPNDNA